VIEKCDSVEKSVDELPAGVKKKNVAKLNRKLSYRRDSARCGWRSPQRKSI